MSVETATANTTPSHAPWAVRLLGAGLLTATMLAGVTATGANAAGVDGFSEPQVAAITASGLVRISTEWSGYVTYDSASGPVRSDQVSASATCSGFVADSSGYVVTAGHCVDPQQGRVSLIRELVAGLVNGGTLTDAEAQALTPRATQSWVVEGATDGSQIDRQVSVSRGHAGSAGPVAESLTASVADLRSVDQGDVALLKVQAGTPLPALRVAQRESEVGAQIAVLGYPKGTGGVVDPSLAPIFTSSRTSAQQSSNGLPFLQLNAAVTGMSGAPVVDLSGDVVGIISAASLPMTEGFTFATAAETIASIMSRNGVDRTLNESDRIFRAGLTSYFGGHLDEALVSFDRVLAAVPDHQVALEFRSKATQSLTEHTENRVGGNKASGVAVAAGPGHSAQLAAMAAEEPSDSAALVWCGGIVLVLLAALGLATGWLRRRSARSALPRATSTPVQNAVLAASRSGNAPIAGRRFPAARALPVGTPNSIGTRHAVAPRSAVAPRFIPADMMCTTVPADLMRTTVCPELLQTAVMS